MIQTTLKHITLINAVLMRSPLLSHYSIEWEKCIHFQLNQWRLKSINTGSLTAFNRNICINQRHWWKNVTIACDTQFKNTFSMKFKKKSSAKYMIKEMNNHDKIICGFTLSKKQNQKKKSNLQLNIDSLIQSSEPWFFSQCFVDLVGSSLELWLLFVAKY